VVGQAQARYLWILLLAGLFYWALHSNLQSGTLQSKEGVRVPLLGLDLSGATLWASGPVVIFLLIVIIHGTLRAFRTAQEALKLDCLPTGSTEPYDLAPNAIDFTVYTPRKASSTLCALLLLAYPVYLSI
jgi:hypothetical protein